MKIPEKIYKKIKARLWAQADRDNWMSLSDQQKSALYEHWSTDKEVGVVLGQFMDKAEVRVYLKDSIMKPYGRERTRDAEPALKAVGIDDGEVAVEDYEKPHGRLFFDKRVVCWGQARDWKTVLVAVYERAYRNIGSPYAAVLSRGVGKMAQPGERALVEDLAKRLGIERVVWLD